jgi:hypothetical protein
MKSLYGHYTFRIKLLAVKICSDDIEQEIINIFMDKA